MPIKQVKSEYAKAGVDYTSAAMLIVVLSVVGFKTMRAARANPVDALRVD